MPSQPTLSTCLQCGRSFKNINSHYKRSSTCVGPVEILPDSVSSTVTGQVPLAKLLANLKSTRRIIRRIPKGARSFVATALSNVINKVVLENSILSWTGFFCFSAVCLRVPAEIEGRSVSLATRVKSNVEAFREGQTLPSFSSVSGSVKRGSKGRNIGKIVEAKIADGDIAGAVRIISSEDSFAPHDDATLLSLREKHPPGLGHDCFDFEDGLDLFSIPHLTVDNSEVRAAILSFPAGSAGGLDSLTPQHLKDLTGPGTGAAGEGLLFSLTKLCNLILGGHVPQEICPVLFGASLCALNKKDGGIRPIAVGNTIRRLVAKLGCTSIMPSLGTLFCPIQLGFGTRGGAEAAAHAARRYVNHPHQGPKVLLKLDFKNAFNMVRRDRFLECVYRDIPALYPFLRQCYKSPSHLVFGDNLIASDRGVQQGDPLGPALFCLVVQKLAERMTSEFNVWYLDDASLGGDPRTVLDDLISIKSLSADVGLDLNPTKCELLIVNHGGYDDDFFGSLFRVEAPGMPIVDRANFVLLGAPLSDDAISNCISVKTAALRVMAKNLDQISSHCGFFLLKHSLAIPKLLYLLRCSPSWFRQDDLSAFDTVLRQSLENVANIRMSEESWEQFGLPVSRGGFGVRHACKTALPAFLASSSGVEAVVQKILPTALRGRDDPYFNEGVHRWRALSQRELPPRDLQSIQREWEFPLVDASLAHLHGLPSDTRSKARLLAISSKESGAWLNALPSPSLGTLLDDDSFRIAAGLRLGAQICVPHVCRCGAMVDSWGTHGLSCKRSSGRSSRHSAVNDILRRALVSAGLPSVLEPPGLCRDDGKRPDGMTLVPWSGGKPLVWDFTCTDPLAPSYVDSSSSAPLWAAAQAEARKRSKYVGLAHRFVFSPIAIETLGSFGAEGSRFVHAVGRKIREASGERRSTAFLFQQLAIAVQRGNAASIMGTFPPGSSLEEKLFNFS